MISMNLCFFSVNECVDENMAHEDSDPDVAILHMREQNVNTMFMSD